MTFQADATTTFVYGVDDSRDLDRDAFVFQLMRPSFIGGENF